MNNVQRLGDRQTDMDARGLEDENRYGFRLEPVRWGPKLPHDVPEAAHVYLNVVQAVRQERGPSTVTKGLRQHKGPTVE